MTRKELGMSDKRILLHFVIWNEQKSLYNTSQVTFLAFPNIYLPAICPINKPVSKALDLGEGPSILPSIS